jgi:UDP-glucose 4-epimerase
LVQEAIWNERNDSKMKIDQVLSEYSNKRILITGGAGCIGSNLVKKLLEYEPQKLIAIDDLSASYEWNLPKNSKLIFIKGSILDEEKMRHAFSFRPHFVFHLAAHFANQNSIDNPETDLLVNGLGTLKTLEYARSVNVEKFVFASSGCSVYGNQAPLPLKEDFISIHLDTPYQINKLVGEVYCNFFHDYYKLPLSIARYFNVYGPGEVPGQYRNVIPNFMWWAINREALPITGTGDETRDFTFVEDIVEGTLRLGIYEEAIGEAINLASETETKIIDIAVKINEITGNTSGIKKTPRRDWDKITRRRASIEKASKLIGYVPKTKIFDGLLKTHYWFQKYYSNIEQVVNF